MAQHTPRGQARFDRERVVAVAIALADRDGIEAISMRKVAAELQIDPMSLYARVANKDDLLDAMSDAVVAEVPRPQARGEWATELRNLILAARDELLRHPWAPALIIARAAPTPAGLRHVDSVLDILLTGGFSVALAHHALHVLGSRILGFGQDLYPDNGDTDGPTPDLSALPRLAQLASTASHDGGLGGCDDDEEFLFGLDLIIEGLERRRA